MTAPGSYPNPQNSILSLCTTTFPALPKTGESGRPFTLLKQSNPLSEGLNTKALVAQKKAWKFTNSQKKDQIIHIGWTRNGKLARLRDCYSCDDLEALSEVYSRSGKLHEERPDFLSQSATIFIWKGNHHPVVSGSAGVVPNLVASQSTEGYRYYDFHTTDWQGVIRAQSREEAEILAKNLGPEAISKNEEQGSLRKGRNAVWKITDPRDSSRFLVVKKPRKLAWNKKILDRNKPSKALRSWNGTSELMRRNIGTPVAVAYFESADPTDMINNWFICDHVAGELTTKSFFGRYSAGDSEVEGFSFDEFSDHLVEFLLLLHDGGCYFRDLSVGNLLVKGYQDNAIQFSLIDTARMRCHRKALPVKHRVSDLKRLILKLAPPLQEIFMKKYMKRLKKKYTSAQRLSLKLYALKTDLKRLKRRLRKKFAKSEPK